MPPMRENVIEKYDNEWLWCVLCLTQSHGNLYNAVTLVHTEDDLFAMLDELQTFEYLFFDGENKLVVLTNKGLALYNTLTKKLNKRGLYRYMIPNLSKRNIFNRPENNIYIPTKKDAEKLL